MSEEKQDPRERADRFRACAARLRIVAHMARAPISPEYVEELARDLDRYAEDLEHPDASAAAPLPAGAAVRAG
jgi:hypothetical protein